MTMDTFWRARLGSIGALLYLGLTLSAPAQVPSNPRVPASTHGPKGFGLKDYTVTVIPASAFTSDTDASTDFGSLFRYFAPRNTAGGHFFHGVSVPSGAVIDFIGLETQDNGRNAYQANLYYMTEYAGSTSGIVSVDFGLNGHYGYDTAYNPTPLGWQLATNRSNALVMDVYQRPYDCPFPCDPGRQISFGWVEIWWKRTVPEATPFASFNDVPPGALGFDHIEALKASGITGGCTPDKFCPDDPVKRRQMAIFLAKALGLFWAEP